MAACTNCGQENPDEARFCLKCGTPLQPVGPAREARKVVTVLFSDVIGSTGLGERLDPETLRRVMARYFDEMKAALEAHGGTVEKFIGDAVMAVFGIPMLHEDDALRAVRAALEIRERLGRLNSELERDRGIAILIRTGINTGEVVAGDPATGQTLVTGDAVNVAARLEQAAQPGEILIGEATYRVLRDAVAAEAVQPLSLKGKEDPVAAYRLLEVLPGAEAVRRRLDSPMVGRDRQLALLRQTFESAAADRSCHLFTVIGSPGVGKSRLVHEFLRGVQREGRVLRGRCLPYGDGITYWPVAEMLKEAAAIGDQDAPEASASKIASLAVIDEREAVTERLMQALGLAEATAPAEEIAWAFRKLLEALARDRPAVPVFDDIQWAEPTLLELIDHVADWSRDAPIMLVAIARQELLDTRPGWAGGKHNATTIQLEPLTERDCEVLVENLLGRALLPAVAKSRIAEAAEGNPLFVEQVLSMLIDDGLLAPSNGHWAPTADLTTIPIPPTIHALLAARLDRLGAEERQVIERASVVGKVFFQSAVSELAPEPLRAGVGSHLMTLVRKELIRPDQSDFLREPTFRFRHLLIRDAAYAGMPKEVRAALHEGFAAWLERIAGDRVTEYEEVLGYHLEEAYRYRVELGTADDRARSLALRASEHLAAAGRRAMNRGDLTAAESLLGRSVELLPADEPRRLELLVEKGRALIDLGEFARADPVMEEVIARAEAMGNRALALRARLIQAIRSDSAQPWGDRLSLAEEAIPFFEHSGDDRGLFEATWVVGAVHWVQGRSGASELLFPRMLELARQLRDPRRLSTVLHWHAGALVWGPTPAGEGLRVCNELQAEAVGSRFAEASILAARCPLEAMLGRAEEARTSGVRARAIFDDLGATVYGVSALANRVGLADEILGDFEAVEAGMRPAMEMLIALGEKSFLSTLAPQLGRLMAMKGRLEEAEDLARLGREAATADDWSSQVLWRLALSWVLAGRGELEEAERVAREAVDLTKGSDYLYRTSSAWEDLAHVLELSGRKEEAASALGKALALQEAKGAVVSAARTRQALLDLG
jgi:class 3 adenylate cyclase/tetratricopeptide (TPR) repeat protein